jgi:hypothetical protein
MKQMNHTDYIKKTRTMDEAQLRYVIQDATEAMQALPNNPNNGYYQDEIHYCAMELHRRSQKKSTKASR